MSKRTWTAEQDEWLRENWGRGDVNDTIRAFRERFGCDHGGSKHAFYAHAWNMGLRKRVGRPQEKLERTVHWKREPEKERWMLENDRGQGTDILSEQFRERFGFGLNANQICYFRSTHGIQSRCPHGHPPVKPVGSELRTTKGYILVKVAPRPEVPQGRDNWVPKHRLVWEREHGRPVPDGMCVVAADGDLCNCDPANLLAVPMDLMPVLNTGPRWHDMGSLLDCIALAELRVGIVDALNRPRTCAVCGREFVPRDRRYALVRTCPDCVDAGCWPPWREDDVRRKRR